MSELRRHRSDWRGVVQRLGADPRSVVAASVLLGLALIVTIGPMLAQHAPNAQLDITKLAHVPPSRAHLLGTDAYSRDVLARVLSGGRISLLFATSAVLVQTLVGTCVGLFAGLSGHRIDAIAMRGVDAGASVPRVLFLLALLAPLPHVPLWMLVLAMAFTGWFVTARLVRGEVRAIRTTEFVHAAHALGASRLRIAMRHLLPHVLGPVLVTSTLAVGHVIVLEAGLSWLGVGVQAPQASWGNIIADGTEFLSIAPWVSLAPGFCLVAVVLAASAFGDGLRDALAPRQLPRT